MNNLTNRDLKEWTKINAEEGLFFDIEDDKQFYFLMGQVAVFVLRKADSEFMASEMKRNIFWYKGHSTGLRNLIFRYYTVTCRTVTLSHDLAFNRALGAIMGWEPDNELSDYKYTFICGFTAENFLDKYKKVYEDE